MLWYVYHIVLGAKLRRLADSGVHYVEYFVYYAEKMCTNGMKRNGIGEICVPLLQISKQQRNEDTFFDTCPAGQYGSLHKQKREW